MERFPSKYAHLPTSIEEYQKLIFQIEDKMKVEKLDEIIANIKNKEKVDKHYRRNFKNLGLFLIIGDEIRLNNNVILIKEEDISLNTGLRNIVLENYELVAVLRNVLEIRRGENRGYTIKELANILADNYYDTPDYSIKRWISPILFLFEYTNLLDLYSKNDYIDYLRILERVYLDISNDRYGEAIPIKKIAAILTEKYSMKKEDLDDLWINIYNDKKLIFKVSLLTFPDWYKEYGKIVVNGEAFTHIKINNKV